MVSESTSRAERIRQGRQSCRRSLGSDRKQIDCTFSQYEMTGRIVVSAGIFLMLFLCGQLLEEPSRETVQSWIKSDFFYEETVEKTAAWIEEKLSDQK